MIYRLSTPSRDVYLTGTPGLDLSAIFAKFKAGLSKDTPTREVELLAIIESNAPGEEPEGDLLGQAFVATICEVLDLRRRDMTVFSLA